MKYFQPMLRIVKPIKRRFQSLGDNFRDDFNVDEKFGVIYNRKNNSFDIFRFFFASMVIYSHAYPLLYSVRGKADIINRFSKAQLSGGGELAVQCFFIISGFLVAQSLVHSKTYIEYLIKRSLRIFPALIVSSLITAFVLGPLITKMSLSDYFFGPDGIAPWEYVWKNTSFNLFGYAYPLRDLFSSPDTPYPNAVNGSLWTLKHEFASYIFLMVLSFFGFIRYRKLLFAFFIFMAMLCIGNISNQFMLFQLPNSWWVFGMAEYEQFVKLFYYFLAGSIIFLYKDEIVYSNKFILLAVIILLISNATNHLRYVMLIALPYLVIGLGIKWKIQSFTRYGDFSYGVYIYAFPIEQTLVMFFKESLSATKLTIFAFIITLVFAIFSWYLVEKPMLNLKKKLQVPASVPAKPPVPSEANEFNSL